MNNICFDIFKNSDCFLKNYFVYDLKILYDLEGKETDSFYNLAINVLGHDKTFEYFKLLDKANDYYKSYKIAKIDINKFSSEKLLPNLLMENLNKQKKILFESLLEQSKEKEFYIGFFQILKRLFEISQKPIFIDLDAIKNDDSHFSNLIRSSVKDNELYLNFNPVGAKTGRLSFRKGSVNLYILPKDLRRCVVAPKDYLILQLDFKSFQPRLAIACCNDVNFKNKFFAIEDIYSIFPGEREENKISFLSWLFSLKRHNIFDEFAKPILDLRNDLYKNAQREGGLVNPFFRKLYFSNEEENVVFQNYITSLEVDVILSLVKEFHDLLRDKKSRILTPFHDSIIFYIHKNEMHLIQELKLKMEYKSLFNFYFPVSVKISETNFRDLKNFKGN